MSKKSRWLDAVPVEKKRAKNALSQTDRTDMGTVTEIMGDGNVAVHVDESSDPDVVAPVVAGVTGLGARVRLTRDSTGRVIQVEAPDRLPEGADPVFVGVTGETVEKLADAQVDLDEAMGELDTKVGEAESNAAQAVADAASAQTSVNGVNARMTSVADPSVRPNGASLVAGDEWFVDDGAGQIVDVRIWDGTRWVPYKLVLSSLAVAGSVGNILLENGAVDATKITASESLWAKIGVFAEITTQMLVAGGATITGELLADVIKVVTRIVAGNPDGTRSEMDPFGFHVYRANADGNVLEAMRFGQDADNDFLQLNGSDGSIIASIDEAGGASFQSVDAGDSLTLQGNDMGSLLDARSSGIVAWGGGWPWSGQPEHTLNGDESLCDMTVDLDATRMYSFAVSFGWKSNNDSAAVETRLRMTSTTDGSTPPSPTSSTSVWGSRRFSGQKSGQSRHEQVGGWLFQPYTTGTYRILLSMAPAYVSDGATLSYTTGFPVIVVRDEGPVLSQMTNPSLVMVPSGGVPSTPPAVKRYIKDYSCTWSQNYTNTGAQTTSMSQYAVQGSGGGPARRSMLGFQSMVADLNGATINGLWIYGYFQHWWNNAGGTAVFGVHGSASAPGSFSGSVGVLQRGGWPNPGGLWVPIPSHVWNGFKSGSYRGVSLCAPNDSTAAEYYGYMAPGRCKIRADFTK